MAALDAVLGPGRRAEARRRQPVRRAVEAAGRAAAPARVPAVPASGRGVRGGPGRGGRAVVRRPGGGGVCAPEVDQAVRLLRTAPGRLWRSADRLFRAASALTAADPHGACVRPTPRPWPRLQAAAPDAAGWRWSWSPRRHRAGRVRPGAAVRPRAPPEPGLPRPAVSPTGSAARGPRRTGGTPWTGRHRRGLRPDRRRDHDAAAAGQGRHRRGHHRGRAAAVRQAAPGRSRYLPARLGDHGRRGTAALLHLLAAEAAADRLRPVGAVPGRAVRATPGTSRGPACPTGRPSTPATSPRRPRPTGPASSSTSG